jgi:transcriptional regulator with XRE-family HTH domain
MKQLGFKIKELRQNKGLSQEELSELSKVSLRTIQRIEKKYKCT